MQGGYFHKNLPSPKPCRVGSCQQLGGTQMTSAVPRALGDLGFTLPTVVEREQMSPRHFFFSKGPLQCNSCYRLQPCFPGAAENEGNSFLPSFTTLPKSPPTELHCLVCSTQSTEREDRSDIHKSTYYSFSSPAFDSCYHEHIVRNCQAVISSAFYNIC